MVASMAVLVVMEIDKLVVMMAAKMIFFYFLMVDMKYLVVLDRVTKLSQASF